MAETVERSLRPEKTQKREALKPQKIQNFDETIALESAHSQVKSGVGIMGKMDSESGSGVRLITSHGPKNIDFVYLAHADIHQLIKLTQEGKTPPPALIKDVDIRNSNADFNVITRAARNHNAAEVIEYLEKGGDPSYLTTGELIPTMKEIQDYMKKANRKSIADRVKALFIKKQ